MSTDIFDSMVKEAMEEVANHGWKEASQNAVTLAAFGLLSRKLEARIDHFLKPLWTIAGGVIASALWYIIQGIFHLF